ncbi:hypothetical protein SERLA73DRAFT_76019 [Serpula lacrymans var. lacrymans S7.3]|uniref:Peroxisomal ATPase PEX6 n=1 Tax=Serpula lacrymans var. lacrymans (strain S7.3) TaxID=936435 RepID=F8Q5Y4_SERL3|nr:hypothetical protein SERLA73DRAFT_76019 [Serpula lacrymans var. lacrymans S7.3]
MSLFFDHIHVAESTFSTANDRRTRDGFDTVLLNTAMWNSLSTLGEERIVISISAPQIDMLQRVGLRSVVCWARHDETVFDVVIPSHWINTFGAIFSPAFSSLAYSPRSLHIYTAQPVLVAEVVVTALTIEAYKLAHNQGHVLDDWFCQDDLIIREGQTFTFTSNLDRECGTGHDQAKFYPYRVDMVEPCQQGFARKHHTRYIVTFTNIPGEGSAQGRAIEIQHGDDEGCDKEMVEIGESFLSNTVNAATTTSLFISSEDIPLADMTYCMKPLRQPIFLADDEHSIYLRTLDLGKLGILSGDWVIIHPLDCSRSRLVRVSALDDLVTSPDFVFASPLLLHNMCLDASSQVAVRAVPHSHSPLNAPFAESITIERVSSFFSTGNHYQPLYLRALKTYFQSTRHLVKQGDLIAVAIDTDDTCYSSNLGEDEMSDPALYSFFAPRGNELVFFVITHINYAKFTSGSADPLYTYPEIASGALGCWVDANETRIIQAGLAHSQVPDITPYFKCGWPKSGPFLPGAARASSNVLKLSNASTIREAIDYGLSLSFLLKGNRGVGKFTVAAWLAQKIGLQLYEINCFDTVGETDVLTAGTLSARMERVASCAPCILVLRHVDALTKATQSGEPAKEIIVESTLHEHLVSLQQSWKSSGQSVIVFATTSEPTRLAPGILSCFKHEIVFEAPPEPDRYEALKFQTDGMPLGPDVDISGLAVQTAAFVASDLYALVRYTEVVSERRLGHARVYHSLGEAPITTTADLDASLQTARKLYSENIGTPKIPDVSWDDVGGLISIKNDILDTIQLPLHHPELFSDGLKKRSGNYVQLAMLRVLISVDLGILLYGPPGTGKTLLAKAVATSCSLNFFSVKGPELLNMYIGESEANVRRVFQKARDAKPCVIFFDELDSVAPKRGNFGDSGGVMDRIVSQILAELDGMSQGPAGSDIFVIGATNRPDLLDPALLRPGRFDRLLYLGLSESHDTQLDIIQALTRKFRLDPSLDLQSVADRCPFNYTGADFYALCSDAMLNAMSRKVEYLDAKIGQSRQTLDAQPFLLQNYLMEYATSSDTDVIVTEQDFDLALQELVPSISQSEMDHYTAIRDRFSDQLIQDN